MLHGSCGVAISTSARPSGLTAMSSWATQSTNQSRPSCQRGDSPMARPRTRTCGSGCADGNTDMRCSFVCR
jgi:hypothetical protein